MAMDIHVVLPSGRSYCATGISCDATVSVLKTLAQRGRLVAACGIWWFSVTIEGSLEVKLPTIWTHGKAEVGRVREEKSRSEKSREEKERRKKMQVREKVEKSRFTVCFR